MVHDVTGLRESGKQTESTNVMSGPLHKLIDTTARSIGQTLFCYRVLPHGQGEYVYVSRENHASCAASHDAATDRDAPFMSTVSPEDQNAYVESFRDAVAHLKAWRNAHRILGADGALVWRVAEATPELHEDGSIYWYGAVRVPSKHIEPTDEGVRQYADVDWLTGLPNRQLFCRYLKHAIVQAPHENQPLALIVIDLDRFQEVNEEHGYDMGDLLLAKVAQRMSGCVSDGDMLARNGGDEFIVLLKNRQSVDGIVQVMQQLLYRIEQPFHLEGIEAHVSASMGVAFYPKDAGDHNELLKCANLAMSSAKKIGRNRFHYFTNPMRQVAHSRRSLVGDLRHTLKNMPFRLHYQPIIDMASGRIAKVEALIRWEDPVRGTIGPAEFIPIAEEIGIIDVIGDWVFLEAARQVALWRRTLSPTLQVSFNMSPLQFRRAQRISSVWRAQLESLALSGDGLIVEITEGLLLEAGKAVIREIQQFRQMGMQVALDDFGTGHSSLSYLKRFRIDYIKIDQSFVQNLAQGMQGKAICEAIILMAHKLDMQVVAEGVEYMQQRDLLKSIGCDYAQGYWYARPLPAPDFEKYYKQHY